MNYINRALQGVVIEISRRHSTTICIGDDIYKVDFMSPDFLYARAYLKASVDITLRIDLKRTEVYERYIIKNVVMDSSGVSFNEMYNSDSDDYGADVEISIVTGNVNIIYTCQAGEAWLFDVDNLKGYKPIKIT